MDTQKSETPKEEKAMVPKQGLLADRRVRLVLLGIAILVVAYLLYSVW